MKWIVDAESIDDLVLGNYAVQDMPLTECKDCKYFLDSSERYGIVDTRLHFYECGIIDTRLHFYETDKRWTGDSFCSWAERREK